MHPKNSNEKINPSPTPDVPADDITNEVEIFERVPPQVKGDLEYAPKYSEIFEAAKNGFIRKVLNYHEQFAQERMPYAQYFGETLFVPPLAVLCQKLDKNHSANSKNGTKPTAETLEMEELFINLFKKLIDFYITQSLQKGADYLNMGGEKSVINWFDTRYKPWGKKDDCFCKIRTYLKEAFKSYLKQVPKKTSENSESKWWSCFGFLNKKSKTAIERIASVTEIGSNTMTSSSNSSASTDSAKERRSSVSAISMIEIEPQPSPNSNGKTLKPK